MTAARPDWTLIGDGTVLSLDGWKPVYGALMTCPRCFAVVEKLKRLAHCEWHAATDYPIPEALRQQVARAVRAA